MTNGNSRRGRTIAFLWIGLFLSSATFPVVASFAGARGVSVWIGVFDVTIAATMVAASIMLTVRHRTAPTMDDKLRAFAMTRIVIAVISILLALFFTLGDTITWDVLVIGLAWRGWLLIYTLPYLFATLRRPPDGRRPCATSTSKRAPSIGPRQ